jgi:hypothetical protein
MREHDERRRAAAPPADLDAQEASTGHPGGHHRHAASGGERYQSAHRQHAVERRGTAASRSARGSGRDAGQRLVGRPDTPAFDAAASERTPDGAAVHLQPDDEAWLNDLGYPKLGEHLQSRTTQHEHGPNAGGTQQGDTKPPASRVRRQGSAGR